MTRADRLATVINEFLDVSPDVEAAAVVSGDGLPMASALPEGLEEDRIAAMSAALLSLGERAAENLGKGELGQVFVEGSEGYVVLMGAGQEAVVVAITTRRAKVGLVLFEMKRAAAQVADIMRVEEPQSEWTYGEEPPAPAPEELPAQGAAAGYGEPQSHDGGGYGNWQSGAEPESSEPAATHGESEFHTSGW